MAGRSRALPVAALIYGPRFWRGAVRVPSDVRGALTTTLRALESDPTLPGPEDVKDILAPSLPVWRRRIAASAWWVYFEVQAERTIIVAVAVPMY